MNMWFWPFLAEGPGVEPGMAFHAGASVAENLHHFFVFTVITSTFGWDTGRAVTNLTAILLIGPAVLAALRRAARRAAFDAPVTFERAPAPAPAPVQRQDRQRTG